MDRLANPQARCTLAVAVTTALASLSGYAHAQDSPVMRDFIGFNGHAYSMTPHVDLYAPVATQVRDYHGLKWDLRNTNDAARFPRGAVGNDTWLNWDYEYGTWAAAGLRTNMDIMFEQFGEDEWVNMATDAYNYGKAVGQYFGPTGGGAGLITSVEIGNEPGNYSDANFVTVVRNMAQGIRDYAPSLPIVTCNVKVAPSGTYHKNVDLFRTNDMLHLVDVIATHVYPMLNQWPTWERSYPEDPRLSYLAEVQALLDWRDTYAPDKQVWVTEFGYDATTQPQNASGTFKDMHFVTDKQQAQYLVRSYLCFAAMGVDRAYMYYFNDEDQPSLHASSGMTRSFVPKPSYYAIRHMNQTLGDYRFSSVITEEEGHLYVHSYMHESDENSLIWVAWSPTGSDREVLITLDNLPGTVLFAEQMALADGIAPLVPFVMLDSDSVQLIVGESPVYLHIQVPEPSGVGLALTGATLLLRRRR